MITNNHTQITEDRMLAPERHELILRSLRRHGRLRVAELAAELGVSAITVRRDLAELDSAGLLRRVHGGAVGTSPGGGPVPGSQLTIGIVVPSSTFYYTDVIRGAEAMADRYGARLVLGVSGYNVAVEQERLEKVLGIGVAGLLLSTALGDGRAGELGPRLDDIDVPVVLMERAFGFPHVRQEYDHVRTDHAYGAMLALRHLVSLGHRRITFYREPGIEGDPLGHRHDGVVRSPVPKPRSCRGQNQPTAPRPQIDVQFPCDFWCDVIGRIKGLKPLVERSAGVSGRTCQDRPQACSRTARGLTARNKGSESGENPNAIG